MWFYALLLVATSPTGISGKFLMRHLGITEKAAWRMLWLIKLHVQAVSTDLSFSGELPVEVDETLLTGLRSQEGGERKAIVFGLIDGRGVRTVIVPDRKRSTIFPIITQCVPNGSCVVTDSYSSYVTLDKVGYRHEVVNHRKNIWVNGSGYSTARIESYWASLKRSIFATHRHIAYRYLDLYISLHAFRHNARCRGEDPFLAMIDRFPTLKVGTGTA